MDDSLPLWLKYAQALALIAIAMLGSWIAYQQMRIARTKLQHDLFDRRHAVFHAARRLLGQVIVKAGHISFEDLAEFNTKTLDAEFLLNLETAEYLAQLGRRAAKLAGISEETGRPLADPNLAKELAEHVKLKWDEIRWFNDQIDVLRNKFAPFLRFKT